MRFLAVTAFLAALAAGVVAESAVFKWGKLVEGTPGEEVTPTGTAIDDLPEETAVASVEARGIKQQLEKVWNKFAGPGQPEEGMDHELRMRDAGDEANDESEDAEDFDVSD